MSNLIKDDLVVKIRIPDDNGNLIWIEIGSIRKAMIRHLKENPNTEGLSYTDLTNDVKIIASQSDVEREDHSGTPAL